jgi:SAM-dependent methyltransferase
MTRIVNTDQYEAWNGESGRRWVSDPDHRDRLIAPIADALFDTVQLAAGECVLDIGCGCGATTLAAGRAVVDGDVLGVDLSAPMLEVARRRRDAAGLDNVEFEQADVQASPLSSGRFDVAISRFGTMFFADAGAAFANIGRALAAGGRLTMVTWQPLVENEWLTVPTAALLGGGPVPETIVGPGMFGLSDPALITATLTGAGFRSVNVVPRQATLTLGSDPEDAAAHVGDSGVGRAALEALPERERAAALDAVRDAFVEHMTPSGVQLGAAVWVTTALGPVDENEA